jgi:hypothetical protein
LPDLRRRIRHCAYDEIVRQSFRNLLDPSTRDDRNNELRGLHNSRKFLEHAAQPLRLDAKQDDGVIGQVLHRVGIMLKRRYAILRRQLLSSISPRVARNYLIRRDDGNVLVDSPRFTEPLVKNIGSARLMLLTHQDDVADHEQFHQRFGCERVLHRDDVRSHTASVELQPKLRRLLGLDSGLCAPPEERLGTASDPVEGSQSPPQHRRVK